MRKIISQVVSINDEYRKIISYILIGSCLVLGFLYSINLYTVISHTVALKSVRNQTNSLSAEIESLDGKYLKLTSNITPDTLENYGLKQGKVSVFIPRHESLGLKGTGRDDL